MMRITRLTELSLFYKIRELFTATKTGEILKSADFQTYNLKYTNVQLNSTINVYVNGVIQTTGYSLDYMTGVLRFDTRFNSLTEIKIDYSYCPYSIYDEGIDPSSKDNKFSYPAIAVYEATSEDEPIELGSSRRDRISDWVVEIWTENGGANSDIRDTIMELFIEEIKILDYNIAFPTNRNGSLNEMFSAEEQTIGYAIADSINSGKSGSLNIGEKPKYLSEIFVELKIST